MVKGISREEAVVLASRWNPVRQRYFRPVRWIGERKNRRDALATRRYTNDYAGSRAQPMAAAMSAALRRL